MRRRLPANNFDSKFWGMGILADTYEIRDNRYVITVDYAGRGSLKIRRFISLSLSLSLSLWCNLIFCGKFENLAANDWSQPSYTYWLLLYVQTPVKKQRKTTTTKIETTKNQTPPPKKKEKTQPPPPPPQKKKKKKINASVILCIISSFSCAPSLFSKLHVLLFDLLLNAMPVSE